MPPWPYPYKPTLFPTPNPNRNLYYPNAYSPYHSLASDARRRRQYERLSPTERKLAVLRDKELTNAGDLGWTLDYATAWCYRHLIGNQTGIADAVNHLREIEIVDEDTPYVCFDLLDKALFNGKLREMVYVRWKTLPSSSPGITSAPGVVQGIPRICIELNKMQFDDGDADIDDLLDVLIHQMIHAFFLVACGAQPKDAKPDGRLMDGLHFGVILFTIRDITRRCHKGMLDLIFYAANRIGFNQGGKKNKFIALNPRGSKVGLEMADGQSHCGQDNRYVRPAQMQNWQVEKYSVAIDLGMDSKGETVHDIDKKSHLNAVDRLKAPPSSTYVELIWGDKRVMVPREPAMQFRSMRKPLTKDEKMELKVPEECDEPTFFQLYNFFVCGGTKKDGAYWVTKEIEPTGRPKMAPILIQSLRGGKDADDGVNVHVKLFKVAEAMKFEELMEHVLKRLWYLETAGDDPIRTLELLYNDKDNSGPVHAELHKWARGFLQRCDYDGGASSWGYHHPGRGLSNYEKLVHWFRDDFESLMERNSALQDDLRSVAALLAVERSGAYENGVPEVAARRYLHPAANVAAIRDTTTHTLQIAPRVASPQDRWYDYLSDDIHDPWLALPPPARSYKPPLYGARPALPPAGPANPLGLPELNDMQLPLPLRRHQYGQRFV